jgi:hypothetical protein
VNIFYSFLIFFLFLGNLEEEFFPPFKWGTLVQPLRFKIGAF